GGIYNTYPVMQLTYFFGLLPPHAVRWSTLYGHAMNCVPVHRFSCSFWGIRSVLMLKPVCVKNARRSPQNRSKLSA
ncbi:hypothetical protein ABN254_21375, partial [Providencia rettgeri]